MHRLMPILFPFVVAFSLYILLASLQPQDRSSFGLCMAALLGLSEQNKDLSQILCSDRPTYSPRGVDEGFDKSLGPLGPQLEGD